MNKLPNEILLKVLEKGNVFEMRTMCHTSSRFKALCDKRIKKFDSRYNISLASLDFVKINNYNYIFAWADLQKHQGLKVKVFLTDYMKYLWSIKTSQKNSRKIMLNTIVILYEKYKMVLNYDKLGNNTLMTKNQLESLSLKLKDFLKMSYLLTGLYEDSRGFQIILFDKEGNGEDDEEIQALQVLYRETIPSIMTGHIEIY